MDEKKVHNLEWSLLQPHLLLLSLNSWRVPTLKGFPVLEINKEFVAKYELAIHEWGDVICHPAIMAS